MLRWALPISFVAGVVFLMTLAKVSPVTIGPLFEKFNLPSELLWVIVVVGYLPTVMVMFRLSQFSCPACPRVNRPPETKTAPRREPLSFRVETNGIEPSTSAMPSLRCPSLSVSISASAAT